MKFVSWIVKFWPELTATLRFVLKVVELSTMHEEDMLVKEQEAPDVDISVGTIRRIKEPEIRGFILMKEIL